MKVYIVRQAKAIHLCLKPIHFHRKRGILASFYLNWDFILNKNGITLPLANEVKCGVAL